MRHEMASGESSKQRKYARPEKENRLAPVPRNQISIFIRRRWYNR